MTVFRLLTVTLGLMAAAGCSDDSAPKGAGKGGTPLPAGGFEDKTAGGEASKKGPGASAGESTKKKFD